MDPRKILSWFPSQALNDRYFDSNELISSWGRPEPCHLLVMSTAIHQTFELFGTVRMSLKGFRTYCRLNSMRFFSVLFQHQVHVRALPECSASLSVKRVIESVLPGV
jgi:hypothetical protein